MPANPKFPGRGRYTPPASSKKSGKPGASANTTHRQMRSTYESGTHKRTHGPSGGGITEKKWTH